MPTLSTLCGDWNSGQTLCRHLHYMCTHIHAKICITVAFTPSESHRLIRQSRSLDSLKLLTKYTTILSGQTFSNTDQWILFYSRQQDALKHNGCSILTSLLYSVYIVLRFIGNTYDLLQYICKNQQNTTIHVVWITDYPTVNVIEESKGIYNTIQSLGLLLF